MTSDPDLIAPALPQRLFGLPPIVSSNTRLLVLGSFPGAASLARQQYYAHPQNQFWKILHALWPDSPHPLSLESYEERCEWLLARGLGVWDVYASCERVGSLDTAIRQPQVNDFARLAADCPQLRAIAHNGGESFKHARHVTASLLANANAGVRANAHVGVGTLQGAAAWPVYKLPSTSPAHASWSFERKFIAWREVVAAAGLL
jgi:hypoxanthine-DNA glycosylase